MKLFRLLTIALVCFSLGLGVSACVPEEDDPDPECTEDEDCPDGEQCNLEAGGVCEAIEEEPECTPETQEEDCAAGEICDAVALVCIPEPECSPETAEEDCGADEICHPFTLQCVDPAEVECFDDVECPIGQFCDTGICEAIEPECAATEECEEDQVCTTIGTCEDVADADTYVMVEIEDRTGELANERCADTTGGNQTAGIKLMYALLYNSTGQFLGAGHHVEHMLGENADFGAPEEIFNGNPPAYAGMCPDVAEFETAGGETRETTFRSDVVAAMGCGGYVIFEFRDIDGNVIPLATGYEIRIGEYGPQCSDLDPNFNPQQDDEFYTVHLCEDTASCLQTVAEDETGIVSVDLDLD